MILHPTVVIGLGSTGKFVVANAQRYLYEVLNGEKLNLFKFMVLETAVNEQDKGWTAPGINTKPIDIKVQDIGAAYHTLKLNLADEFNWCPPNMHIVGPGAGNKRAGGRLMLFSHMEKIQEEIEAAIGEVTSAAGDRQTTTDINNLLRNRGGNQQQHPLPDPPVPSVLVVGTLAGGTCSGACVDLGYLLRRVAPNSNREALFFLPDNTGIANYKANSWAALSDLIYFTENPRDYEAVWLNKAQSRVSYREANQPGPMPPYKRVYLVTQRDRAGNVHLTYRNAPSSPLLMMGGLYVAANLLGLNELRQTRLVDLPERVDNVRVHYTFLTHSARGVSYPKYEISEGAACKIISDHICQYWLNSQACWDQGRREELQKEEVSKIGRDLWNRKCQPIWEGLRANANLTDLARRIRLGQVTDVAEHLKAQITENREGTVFRAIDQNVENRGRELQDAIRIAFVEALQKKQNLQYAEWFLDGVRAEIDRTRKYWEAIQIPTGENDGPGWQAKARRLGEQHVTRQTGLSTNLLVQRMSVIEDELEQIVCRLEMFLMYRTLGEISRWVDSDLRARADSIRSLLNEVQHYAVSRGGNIAESLQDITGPLLKVSRSAEHGFAEEIVALARFIPVISGRDFIDYTGGSFSGILCFIENVDSTRDTLFEELIDRIQPKLIQQLQDGHPIDIVAEIERQHVGPQAAQRANATQALSLTTRGDLMVGEANVPSFLLTKSVSSSERLENLLRRSNPNVPVLHKDELPLFDHMALFYQEGGRFDLDSLLYGGDMKHSFNEARRTDEAVIDPLRLLKRRAPPPDLAVSKTSAAELDRPEPRREP